ncbi:MAG: methyltransferase domain-containing protein [Candidatus Taylorbacteria bacterium]|nr:methyltransferase domain-containing protein [Candidatus Taylorbacteria bacterium]
MNNHAAWEREYRNPKLVTLHNEPQSSVKEFFRWLRKKENVELTGLHTLDLGCGTGRNTLHLASEGVAQAVGIDISKTAIEYAQKAAATENLTSVTKFIVGSIGEQLPFTDQSFDLILDVTASNALSEKERLTYVSEMHRLLKPNGHIFVRALCKDGDTNAKELIKASPGPETDTYIMPDTGFIERVFSKTDFEALYGQYFTVAYIDKETHYTLFNGRRYKRNFWIAYLKPLQNNSTK